MHAKSKILLEKIFEGKNFCVAQIETLSQEKIADFVLIPTYACIDVASQHSLKNFCGWLKELYFPVYGNL